MQQWCNSGECAAVVQRGEGAAVVQGSAVVQTTERSSGAWCNSDAGCSSGVG